MTKTIFSFVILLSAAVHAETVTETVTCGEMGREECKVVHHYDNLNPQKLQCHFNVASYSLNLVAPPQKMIFDSGIYWMGGLTSGDSKGFIKCSTELALARDHKVQLKLDRANGIIKAATTSRTIRITDNSKLNCDNKKAYPDRHFISYDDVVLDVSSSLSGSYRTCLEAQGLLEAGAVLDWNVDDSTFVSIDGSDNTDDSAIQH